MRRSRQAIIVTAVQRTAANTALRRQGYGPGVFSVELIPSAVPQANPPATHYGCSWAMTDADKLAVQKALARAGVTYQIQSQQNRSFDEAIGADGRKRVLRGM